VENDTTAVADSETNDSAPASGGDSGSDVVIETRNLSKIYRDFWGRKKVHALKSLDIEVRPGEIFGLLGPNGSGKSTTIKLILGLLFPSSGRVLVFDKDAGETSKNERIGYLPEESYLYKFLTAEETLDFYGRLFNMSGAERKKRVDELVKLVGLQGAKHRQLREYSKGMTRRVGLAQALINDPDLILLDEPTTGLDPIGTREMKDLILGLRDQGKTILLCSHQLADVQDVCDRVAILHQGELKELGRVSDLLKVQDITEVHAGGLSEAAKQEIAEVIKRHGGDLKSIDNPTATMEDLFLNIVRESEARPGARRVSGSSTPDQSPTSDSSATDGSGEASQ
jgi:ABC-2 type transport system ATP-binding protein